MQGHIYVGLSAQQALMRRLDSLAQNIANVSTVGYRAEEISFASLLSSSTADGTNFVTPGQSYTSRKAGAMVETSNPFDIAVSGDAWLSVQTPAGRVLTRDGRMKITPEGELRTVTGYQVLDAGGSPLRLNPNGGPPTIARDGTISQSGRQVATIGLFAIDPEAKITRFENAGIMTDRPATPQLDFNATSIIQGFVEQSNVDPVTELTRLVTLQRLFDAVNSTMNDSERSLGDAIRTLGG
jgi:flagellar basal-body rod protein FlgF